MVSCVGFGLRRPLRLGMVTSVMGVSRQRLLHVVDSTLSRPLCSCITERQMRQTMLCVRARSVDLRGLTKLINCSGPRSFSGTFGGRFNVSPGACVDELEVQLGRYRRSKGRYRLRSRICGFRKLGLMCVHV